MRMTKTFQKARGNRADSEELYGYPEYSEDQDIYNKAREESEIDPENVYDMKDSFYEEAAAENADNMDITSSVMDDDLDMDKEGEENSYYSMSGKDDLEDLI
jgi:hypothetical protein